MWKTKKSSKKCLQNYYAYVLMVAYGQTVNKNNNNIAIEWSANGICDPSQLNGVRTEEGSNGKVALRIVLEAGGFYCVNN